MPSLLNLVRNPISVGLRRTKMGMDSGDSNKFNDASRARRSRNAKKQNRNN